MKRQHLRRLIILGTVVLTGLIIVQVYWFSKAFDIEEKQLDHRIQIALMRVADSLSTGAEVKKLSSNFYFVATESHLDGKSIDTLLKSEFVKRNLTINYELGVYNAEDDTLVYGQYVEGTRKARMEQDMIHTSHSDGLKNFAVYLPGKQTYVVAQLDIWIFSTLALLLMMCFFAWSIVTLLRERRFAELKSDFIDNMTHEFKTPVTNIAIAAEILRKKIPDGAGLDLYLDILAKENERLKQKIEMVLLGSSVGQRQRSMERVDLHQLIRDCADSFNFKVRERNGSLHVQLNANNRVIVGDRELLAQAINNVIDNAEKYSPARPQIDLITSDRKDGIEIVIRDRGIGVPPGLQSRVFEKFFRVQHGDIHNIKGFGLGLNFVQNVIQSHRGKVSLLSGNDQGTQVTILLPTT